MLADGPRQIFSVPPERQMRWVSLVIGSLSAFLRWGHRTGTTSSGTLERCDVMLGRTSLRVDVPPGVELNVSKKRKQHGAGFCCTVHHADIQLPNFDSHV